MFRARRGISVHKAHRVFRARKGILARKGRKVILVHRVFRARKEILGLRGRKVTLVHKAFRARKVFRARKGILVHKVFRARKVMLVHRAHKGIQAHKVILVHRGRPGLQAPQVLLVNFTDVYKILHKNVMDIIDVSVEAIRPRKKQKVFPSIWCSRKGTGNAVEGYQARWEIPAAQEHTVVVVGIYCNALDDDGGQVTHTLGTVKIDASKASGSQWYTLYDSSQQPPLRMGRVKISLDASLNHSVAFKLPLDKLRAAAEKNLQHIAPYGHANALRACGPNLERMHAPYFRTSSGVMLPSGAFLLPEAVVEDRPALLTSMESRLHTVLRRYGMSDEAFATGVRACTTSIDRKYLQIMVETVSFATLHKVKYTVDTQMGKGTDRWETVRLPGSFAGDCEDCAKDLVLECMEWSKHADKNGPRGIDAIARLLSYYVPVMVQGAVGNYKHQKMEKTHNYMNHEFAALHPRMWFEHVTGIEKRAKVSSIHKDLPTLLLEGTAEVYPFTPPLHDVELSQQLEKEHSWKGADTSYGFYNIPIACSSPMYADRGILDFVYTSNCRYGVDFNSWMDRRHGVIVAATHDEEMMRGFRNAMAIERPIRAYVEPVRVVRVPHGGFTNPVRVGYTCSDNMDDVHQRACEVAQKMREKGMMVDVQVSQYDSRYICEWFFTNI